MLTLGTNVELVRRFTGKMSTSAQLSEEKATTFDQLLSNMTRAIELTAELEADNRRCSDRLSLLSLLRSPLSHNTIINNNNNIKGLSLMKAARSKSTLRLRACPTTAPTAVRSLKISLRANLLKLEVRLL